MCSHKSRPQISGQISGIVHHFHPFTFIFQDPSTITSVGFSNAGWQGVFRALTPCITPIGTKNEGGTGGWIKTPLNRSPRTARTFMCDLLQPTPLRHTSHAPIPHPELHFRSNSTPNSSALKRPHSTPHPLQHVRTHANACPTQPRRPHAPTRRVARSTPHATRESEKRAHTRATHTAHTAHT